MTVVLNEKKFDRFWTITAGFLCLLALVLTMIALRTSSWTITEISIDDEVRWNGLFYICNRFQCTWNKNDNFPVIFISIISCLLLLLSTLFVFLMGVHSFPRRHFYSTPTILFLSGLLLLMTMVLYAQKFLTNGISTRIVVTSIIFCFSAVTISSLIAGRYSMLYRLSPIEFSYQKTRDVREMEKTLNEQENDGM